MVCVVTLNPCIDKTVEVNGFVPCATNRVVTSRNDIGGKGINVSLVLKELGCENVNVLINYTNSIVTAAEFLRQNGIETISEPVDVPLRTNIKIFDAANGTMTEINDRGQAVLPESFVALEQKISDVIEKVDVLVLCGSIPPGVSKDVYKKLILKAKKLEVKTILDAGGEAFCLGVEACPTLVKPNLQELEEYTHSKLPSFIEIKSAAEKLIKKGIEYVCVSVGENGAYLFTADAVLHTKGAKIEVKGLQGAGDSMVASFAQSLCAGVSPQEMLTRAVAAAQATVMRSGTELCRKEDYITLLEFINVS